MSDDEILRGFREGDDHITRDYFYGYCQIAYAIHDRRYLLRNKPGLDFHTLAHRYYLDLVLHDWVQLEDRSEDGERIPVCGAGSHARLST